MISKSLHPCAKTDSTVPPKSSARLNVGTITENNGSLAIPSQNLKELAVLPKVTPIVPCRPTGLNDQFALTKGGLAQDAVLVFYESNVRVFDNRRRRHVTMGLGCARLQRSPTL